jgi:hypothetical protein
MATLTERQEFKLTLPLMRSRKEGHILYVEGLASDGSNDDGYPRGRMAATAIVGFVDCVYGRNPAQFWAEFYEKSGLIAPDIALDSEDPYPVKVDQEHSEAVFDQIGYVAEARVFNADDMPQEWLDKGTVAPAFYVQLAVNTNYSHGHDLEVALDEGRKLGLSIAGEVLEAHDEVYPDGVVIRVFDLVLLKKIAVTKQPANKNTWLAHIARSVQQSLGEPIMHVTRTVDNTPEAALEEPAEVTEAEAPEAEAEDAGTLEGEAEVAEPAVEADAQPEAEPVQDAPAPEVEVTEEAPADAPEVEALPDPDAEEAEEGEAEPDVEDVTDTPASVEVSDAPEVDAEPEAEEEAEELDEADEPEDEEDTAKDGAIELTELTFPVDLKADVEELARAQVATVETVIRAELETMKRDAQALRGEVATLKSLLADVPTFIESQNSAIARLDDALEAKGVELSQTREDLQTALDKLAALEAFSLGRRGIVARNVDLNGLRKRVSDMTPAQRREEMAKLKAEGKTEEAWAMALDV